MTWFLRYLLLFFLSVSTSKIKSLNPKRQTCNSLKWVTLNRVLYKKNQEPIKAQPSIFCFLTKNRLKSNRAFFDKKVLTEYSQPMIFIKIEKPIISQPSIFLILKKPINSQPMIFSKSECQPIKKKNINRLKKNYAYTSERRRREAWVVNKSVL